MIVNTRHFGKMDIEEDRIIRFPNGLIAFHNIKNYFIIEREDKKFPVCYLQAIDEPDLAFVIINPFLINPDYDFDIPPGDVEELGIEKESDVAVFSILVVPEDVTKMTANLLAPLVINAKKKIGKQIVLQDRRYSTRHLVLDEIREIRGEGRNNAGANQEKERKHHDRRRN